MFSEKSRWRALHRPSAMRHIFLSTRRFLAAARKSPSIEKTDSVTIKMRGRSSLKTLASAVVRPFQNFFQIFQIVVSEHAEFRAAQFGGIDNRCVNQFVDDDDIVFAGSAPIVPSAAAYPVEKVSAASVAFKLGQRFFQFVVEQGAADQSRCAGARAKFGNCFFAASLSAGFVGQAQVIVGRKIEELASLELDARPLGRIHLAQFAIQNLARATGRERCFKSWSRLLISQGVSLGRWQGLSNPGNGSPKSQSPKGQWHGGRMMPCRQGLRARFLWRLAWPCVTLQRVA